MRNHVYLKITFCKQCPFVDIQKDYTSDSWDNKERWDCKKKKKNIERYIGWTSVEQNGVKIPEWCPLRKQRTK